MNDWGLLGNEYVRALLRELPKGGASLLFTGPPGLGKRTTALWYAAFLNCVSKSETASPCGKCNSCVKIKQVSHPDLRVSEPPEGKKFLGIDEIRSGIEAAGFSPFQGEYKVWVIDGAHRLTEEAQNSMLKILEEPPASLVIILVTDDLNRLLDTVRSRCKIMKFRSVSEHTLVEFLLARGADCEQAYALARLSQGAPGKALRWLEDYDLWEHREAVIKTLLYFLRDGTGDALEFVEKLEILGRQVEEGVSFVLDVMYVVIRDLTVLSVGGEEEMLLNHHWKRELGKVVNSLRVEQLLKAAKSVVSSVQALERNVNGRLVLQHLALQLFNTLSSCKRNGF